MLNQREREKAGKLPNDYDVYDCLFIENAKKQNDLICQPIYEWLDKEIWEFIHDRKMKYNPLYDKGYKRVGCVGCPMASTQKQDLEKYPKYKKLYIRAFQKMVDKRKETGKHLDSKYSKLWKDGESVYAWWVQDQQVPGQLEFDINGEIKEHKA